MYGNDMYASCVYGVRDANYATRVCVEPRHTGIRLGSSLYFLLNDIAAEATWSYHCQVPGRVRHHSRGIIYEQDTLFISALGRVWVSLILNRDLPGLSEIEIVFFPRLSILSRDRGRNIEYQDYFDLPPLPQRTLGFLPSPPQPLLPHPPLSSPTLPPFLLFVFFCFWRSLCPRSCTLTRGRRWWFAGAISCRLWASSSTSTTSRRSVFAVEWYGFVSSVSRVLILRVASFVVAILNFCLLSCFYGHCWYVCFCLLGHHL